MLAIGHFGLGLLVGYLLDKKNLYTAIVCGAIAMFPDTDMILQEILPWQLVEHRNLMHSVIPMSLLGGIMSYIIIKKYWIGVAAYTTHFIGDIMDRGDVVLLPNYYVKGSGISQYLIDKYGLIPIEASLALSTIIGGLIILYIIFDKRKTNGRVEE